MRCSAIASGPSRTPRWPTGCPACGATELAYQHESIRGGDLYRCQVCGAAVHVTECLCDAGSWRRCLRVLS